MYYSELNTEIKDNIRFSPEAALPVLIGICFTVETMQYYEIYGSTFDPYDLLAYSAGVLVVYLTDKIMNSRKRRQ